MPLFSVKSLNTKNDIVKFLRNTIIRKKYWSVDWFKTHYQASKSFLQFANILWSTINFLLHSYFEYILPQISLISNGSYNVTSPFETLRICYSFVSSCLFIILLKRFNSYSKHLCVNPKIHSPILLFHKYYAMFQLLDSYILNHSNTCCHYLIKITII